MAVGPWVVGRGVVTACSSPRAPSVGNTGGVSADAAYMRHLKAIALQALGGAAAVQLYTTDGGDAGYLSKGALPGEIFAVGDGNGPAKAMFEAQDQFNPPGWRAHASTEWYPGWLTHWGEGMQNTSALDVAGSLSGFIAAGGSVNLYMAHGGTNWGFWNGANGGGTSFQPVITSYDYSALLAEGGGHGASGLQLCVATSVTASGLRPHLCPPPPTLAGYAHDGDKYTAAQLVLKYWNPASAPPEPPALPVAAYGTVTLTESAPLWGNQDALAAPVTTPGIVRMEDPSLKIAQGKAVGKTGRG